MSIQPVPPELGELEFDPYPHVYRVRGREIPSVTHLMRNYNLGFQGFAPQAALDRGTYVHEASVLIDANDLDWSSVPEEWRGYCEGYKRAVSELGLKIVVSEWRAWHPELWFAGTCDRIGFRRGVRGIWDLKTGDTTDTDIQLSGYRELWRRWRPSELIEWGACLKLNKDGTYRWTELDLDEGWRIFSACLILEERRRRNGQATGNS